MHFSPALLFSVHSEKLLTLTSDRLRALVIGADGLIGAALYDQLSRRGHTVFGTTRRGAPSGAGPKLFLDLTEPLAAADRLPDAEVAIVCTAMTSFAECRRQPELARLVNTTAPTALARRLLERGMFVVRLSSTAVFQNATPMAPALQPSNSHTLYGRLQAEGESSMLALNPRVSIVRFTKIVTPCFPIMVRWLAALVRGETIEAFADHGLCPVTLGCSVAALTGVVKSLRAGTYQISASRDLSYVELARHLVDRLELPRDRIIPVRAADRGMLAEEITPYSSLNSTSLAVLTGFVQPDPYAVLDQVFGEMIAQARHEIRQNVRSTTNGPTVKTVR